MTDPLLIDGIVPGRSPAKLVGYIQLSVIESIGSRLLGVWLLQYSEGFFLRYTAKELEWGSLDLNGSGNSKLGGEWRLVGIDVRDYLTTAVK